MQTAAATKQKLHSGLGVIWSPMIATAIC